jgi:chlorobactene glucosyltransferase
MPDYLSSWITMALLTPLLVWRSDRRYRELPQLSQVNLPEFLPSLSIIVPARNEAANLRRLLPSLTATAYPGQWELIVVDDNSTDETADVARELGARVICLENLPKGWQGKPFACHQGAEAASGDWLLFTDADTLHEPSAPAQVVAYALSRQLDGLSVFLKQITIGVIDSLALTVAFSGLCAGLGSNSPLLNGQYILLCHDVYNESDGYAAVSGEVLEDLALGQHLSKLGYQVPMLRGEHVASVRMYDDKTSLWHGLTRLGAGSLRWLGLGSVLTILLITGAITPILALVETLCKRRNRRWALVSWMAVALGFVPWAQRFGSVWTALLAPIGAAVVQIAAVWGLASRLFGRSLVWKGRKV